MAGPGGTRRARHRLYAIGVLALKLALGDGGKATSQQGVLKTIAHGSFGTFLLVLLAIGLDGALRKLAHASYGPLLLGIVAAGLVMFAIYSIADARYRKV